MSKTEGITMTIGMILKTDYPPDIRIDKEYKALLEKGYEVTLLCRRRPGESKEEFLDGLHVFRSVLVTSSIIKKIENLYYEIFQVHPRWKREIRRWIKTTRPDSLHIHDLPLAKTAIKVAQSLGIPVVVDFHENYPAALQQWTQMKSRSPLQLFLKLMNQYTRLSRLEKWVCDHAQRVITVVPEMKERLVQTHKVAPQKVVVIGNTEPVSFEAQPIQKEIQEQYVGKQTLLYVGGFGVHRGLDTAIKAMQYLSGTDVQLLLVGKGSVEVESSYKDLIQSLGLENSVKIIGWQPFETVRSYMDMADICIVPHASNEHTENTAPHKLFQYMLAKKPLLVSSCRPIARMVNESNCGRVHIAGDSRDFAEKAKTMLSDKAALKQFGDNGYSAASTGMFCHDKDKSSLCSMYADLLVNKNDC
ncbi:glycosyltransferase family 4 protein [bacterium]|jgi:glycosyltransferase involved in cell wall biosynthesis|nr:glycosyltransferase family 4 protein [bacterium]